MDQEGIRQQPVKCGQGAPSGRIHVGLVAAILLALLVVAMVITHWMARSIDRSTAPGSPPTREASSGTRQEPTLVRHMLWDSSQLPAYRQCAQTFMARHPDIRIRITQVGWGDYWTSLSTGFIAAAAPDVFVNHLVHAPQYMRHGVLEDLRPLAERDGLNLGDQPPILLKAWQRNGQLLGLPKDWDTVALIVNLDHARRQGVSLEELRAMQWNPADGGSFESLIKRLTIDVSGRNALHPDFDPTRVEVYGFQPPGPGGMAGQTEWSWLAAANGHELQAEPWAPIRFNDHRLAQAIQWLADLSKRGLAAPSMAVRSLGAGALFASGRVAMMADGSWMSTYYGRTASFASTWVRLPSGPAGPSASMLNGTAHSLWAGSKVKPQAWRWIAFLDSEDCQKQVAQTGVVFPSRLSLAELTLQAHRAKGIDTSAFVQAAQGRTFLMPIIDDAARIDDMAKSALESVHLGRQSAQSALLQVDQRIERLRR